ncbi:MAG: SDR family NAD(P)-dependent oxidoreductase [Dehalococcoidia bacterium]
MTNVALVTGAGSGLGAAASRRLARDGWTVAAADIHLERAKAVAADSPSATAFHVDVRDEESVVRLFEAVETQLGAIIGLALVAGGTVNSQDYHPRLKDTPLTDWIETESLNSRGTFLCLREYLRHRTLRPASFGRVVTVSSAAAELGGGPTGVAYAAAKGAILSLTKTAAREAARMGITVNAIAPGAMDTPALHAVNNTSLLQTMVGGVPVGRVGHPDEAAGLIAYLLSEEAGYITGATVDINGGVRMA